MTPDASAVRVTGFDHLVLVVADVERSLSWYCSELGLAGERVDEWRRGEVLFPSLRIDEHTLIDLLAGERGGVNVDHLCLVIEPADLAALAHHNCLALGASANQQRGWVFEQDGKVVTIKVSGTMECSDGAVLHEWCLAGHGLAWRSWWEVGEDIAAGRLVSVLDAFAAPPIGIHALFPQRRHLPLRVRLFLDYLKHTYERPGYWGE